MRPITGSRPYPWLLAAVLVLALTGAPWPATGVPAPGHTSGWHWPLGAEASPPRVVAGFAPPAQRWGAGHRGVDLAGEPGQAVRAAGAGVVAYAGLLAGRGVVSVVHDDLRTTYEPVIVSVRPGQRVAAGEVLGTLRPGGHCGPTACLHWGLRRGETYLDPLGLLGAGPVRLLPLHDAALPAPRARPPGDRLAPAPSHAGPRVRARADDARTGAA